ATATPVPAPAAPAPPAEPGTLDRAEREFAAKHYESAGKLYEQASLAAEGLGTESRERWAYCKLYTVVAQLNQPAGATSPADLEKEVRLALCLAPKLQEYGKELTNKRQERRAPTAAVAPPAADVPVRHLDRPLDGWDVAESASFRVLHHQQRAIAEKAVQ